MKLPKIFRHFQFSFIKRRYPVFNIDLQKFGAQVRGFISSVKSSRENGNEKEKQLINQDVYQRDSEAMKSMINSESTIKLKKRELNREFKEFNLRWEGL